MNSTAHALKYRKGKNRTGWQKKNQVNNQNFLEDNEDTTLYVFYNANQINLLEIKYFNVL